MTFDDIWKGVKGLPDTAIEQVPDVLSVATKKKLSNLSPEEVAAIITSAIEEVNHGSIAPLDILVSKRL